MSGSTDRTAGDAFRDGLATVVGAVDDEFPLVFLVTRRTRATRAGLAGNVDFADFAGSAIDEREPGAGREDALAAEIVDRARVAVDRAPDFAGLGLAVGEDFSGAGLIGGSIDGDCGSVFFIHVLPPRARIAPATTILSRGGVPVYGRAVEQMPLDIDRIHVLIRDELGSAMQRCMFSLAYRLAREGYSQEDVELVIKDYLKKRGAIRKPHAYYSPRGSNLSYMLALAKGGEKQTRDLGRIGMSKTVPFVNALAKKLTMEEG